MITKPTTKIKIDFERDGKPYSGVFEVKREASKISYRLKAEIFDHRGKKIFEKERTGLDYSQVEYALVFVFHQAFVEE